MKGIRIEKWKNKGISEFIMGAVANQIARNRINGIKDFKVKMPLEALPIITKMSIQGIQQEEIDSIRLMGMQIEFY